MPKTRNGGYIIEDAQVVLKKNPYTERPEKKKIEEKEKI